MTSEELLDRLYYLAMMIPDADFDEAKSMLLEAGELVATFPHKIHHKPDEKVLAAFGEVMGSYADKMALN